MVHPFSVQNGCEFTQNSQCPTEGEEVEAGEVLLCLHEREV